MDMNATGKPVDFRGCGVDRFRDGLIVHETAYMDVLGWSRQIGALPARRTRWATRR